MKRYALLDTDFISKTHSVQDDNGNHLIDRVMELPEYEFFCHAQIVTELNRYNADAPIWLSEKIGAQKIKSYTDQEILESLSLVRGPLACATYTQMLKLACDAFSKDYFSEHYRVLEEADYTVISREDYLKELERLDIEVGKKNNLGEIKSFVLLQVLSVMLGEQIYVFCSDDKNARKLLFFCSKVFHSKKLSIRRVLLQNLKCFFILGKFVRVGLTESFLIRSL